MSEYIWFEEETKTFIDSRVLKKSFQSLTKTDKSLEILRSEEWVLFQINVEVDKS